MRSWRTCNNRCRPHYRMIGGEYSLYSRRKGIIWQEPITTWQGFRANAQGVMVPIGEPERLYPNGRR